MLISPKTVALFKSPGKGNARFSWMLYELGSQPDGYLIAIGTAEEEGGASRRLDVQVIDLTGRTFQGSLIMEGVGRRDYAGVRVTPGYVVVEQSQMRGRGIGTLVFNVVTAWAQRTFPELQVQPITLVRPKDASEFERLTRFYGRFGFTWEPPTPGWDKHFLSKPMAVSDLKQHPEELLNVRRIDIPKTLTALLERMVDAEDDARKLKIMLGERESNRACWRTMGSRVNKLGWVLAFIIGLLAEKVVQHWT